MKPAILLALAASWASAKGLPVLLQGALQRQPELQLLDAPIEADLLDAMKAADCWPPWAEVDLDHDGRNDVAVVVVKGTGPDRTYGVMAIHAKQPQIIHWVIPLNKESITGLMVNQPQGAVVPLFCFECDSNPFYRWSRTNYEYSLFQAGEQIGLYVYDERNGGMDVKLYSESNGNSKIVTARKFCSAVKVLKRSGTSANRWYWVETTDPQRIRGWVPSSSVT